MTAEMQAIGLTKRYGTTLALDHLDLDIARGEVYGFLGPNGAGKTTTIRLLLGIHRATEGIALIAGHDAWSDPVAAHRQMAYVASVPTLWPSLTGAETLEYLSVEVEWIVVLSWRRTMSVTFMPYMAGSRQ